VTWSEFSHVWSALDGRILMGDTKMDTRRSQLDREIARHRDKLERAEALREQLAGIPDTDPFPDGMVLVFDARFGSESKTYSYAALRAAGKWYVTGQVVRRAPTGRAGYGLTWLELIGWWIEHRVDMVGFYEQTSVHSLGSLPQPPAPPKKVEIRGGRAALQGRVYKDGTVTKEFPVMFCGDTATLHAGHMWHSTGDADPPGASQWCAGFSDLECDASLHEVGHGPHVWHGRGGERHRCPGG
jgi:hypothetical protein